MASQANPLGSGGPSLGLELWPGRPGGPSLAPSEILEIRRANRRVRGFLAGHAGRSRGAEARDGEGRPVDPMDPRARSFSLVGAFLAAARPSPWLFRRWMTAAHEAAAEILGDPDADVFAYNDAAEIDQEGVMALLDEIDARVTPLVDVDQPTPPGSGR